MPVWVQANRICMGHASARSALCCLVVLLLIHGLVELLVVSI